MSVFTETGKCLSQWGTKYPYIFINAPQRLPVLDMMSSFLHKKFDLSCTSHTFIIVNTQPTFDEYISRTNGCLVTIKKMDMWLQECTERSESKSTRKRKRIKLKTILGCEHVIIEDAETLNDSQKQQLNRFALFSSNLIIVYLFQKLENDTYFKVSQSLYITLPIVGVENIKWKRFLTRRFCTKPWTSKDVSLLLDQKECEHGILLMQNTTDSSRENSTLQCNPSTHVYECTFHKNKSSSENDTQHPWKRQKTKLSFQENDRVLVWKDGVYPTQYGTVVHLTRDGPVIQFEIDPLLITKLPFVQKWNFTSWPVQHARAVAIPDLYPLPKDWGLIIPLYDTDLPSMLNSTRVWSNLINVKFEFEKSVIDKQHALLQWLQS